MEELRELAKAVTREEDGIKFYGFTFNHDGYQPNFHFPGIVWRNGGEIYEFDGDIPRTVTVDTPEAAAGLGWWRGMVDDGSHADWRGHLQRGLAERPGLHDRDRAVVPADRAARRRRRGDF